MSEVLWITIATGFGISFMALLTLPRWLFTSINRSCLWMLRDKVVLEARRDDLPQRAADRLVGDIEAAIEVAPYLTPRIIRQLNRRLGEIPLDERMKMAEVDDRRADYDTLADAPLNQRLLFADNAGRLAVLLTRQTFTGSWTGVVWTASLVARGIFPGNRRVSVTFGREQVRDITPAPTPASGWFRLPVGRMLFEVPERSASAELAVEAPRPIKSRRPGTEPAATISGTRAARDLAETCSTSGEVAIDAHTGSINAAVASEVDVENRPEPPKKRMRQRSSRGPHDVVERMGVSDLLVGV